MELSGLALKTARHVVYTLGAPVPAALLTGLLGPRPRLGPFPPCIL